MIYCVKSYSDYVIVLLYKSYILQYNCSLIVYSTFHRLLNELDRLISRYLLQDFRCAGTHLVSKRLSVSVSQLSQPLQMDISQHYIVDQCQVLLQVARFHEFQVLSSTVEEQLVNLL